MLTYSTSKMTPIQGLTGFGGGATGNLVRGGAAPEQELDYFITTLNRSNPPNSSDSDSASQIAIGSDGSIYVSGNYTDYIFKLSPNGVLQWQRVYDTGGSGFHGIALDSNDNVYVVQQHNGVSGYPAALIKYNSSGVHQWTKLLERNWTGGGYPTPTNVTIDSNDNIYMTGYHYKNYYHTFVSKWDTSGNLAWAKSYAKTGTNSMDCWGSTTDSSGNIYITGGSNQVNNYYNEAYIAKINSSGTPQWFGDLIGPYHATYGNNRLRISTFSVKVDSSGNSYLCGSANRGQGPGVQQDLFLTKFDSSGNHQWHRFVGTDSYDTFWGIEIDDNDQIYCVGDFPTASSPSTYGMIICKFNGSGNLTYKRILRCHGATSGDNSNARGIAIDSDNNLYISGQTSKSTQDPINGGSEVQVAKVPPDGTLTGTYGDFTYEDPTTLYSSYTQSGGAGYSTGTNTPGLTDLTSGYGFTSSTRTGDTETAGTTISAITTIQEPSTLSIETSGLDIYLDVNNYNSYSGAGNIWTNLSTTGNFGNAILKRDSTSYNTFTSGGTTRYFTNLRAYIPIGSSREDYTPLTYSTWVYPTSINSFHTMIDQGDDQFLFCLHTSNNSSSLMYNPGHTGSQNLGTGQWYNFTVTVTVGSSSSTFRFYKNGVLENTTTDTDTTWNQTFSNWSFGAGNISSGQTGNEPFVGHIGAIMVYNRPLSTAEVLSNYNALKTPYGL